MARSGGLQGYTNHIQGVVKKFDHITVHPDIWTNFTPPSSTFCHLFLHAIQNFLSSDRTHFLLDKARKIC
jgi:hypothetical protein